MLAKIKNIKISLLSVVAIFASSMAIVAVPAKVLAAACTAPSTNYGSVSSSVSIPASATYRVWSRVMAPDTTNNSYLLEIDGNQCFNVGGSGLTANQWVWISHQGGNTSSKIDVSLTNASHTLKMIGNKPGVKLDRVIFASDLACVPTGDGTNCNTPADTTSPVVRLSTPASGSTVSGIVTVSATASDNVGVTKVEFFTDSQLRASDTSSPYSFQWSTNDVANAQYTLIAKAYDAAGNISTDSYRVTVQNGDKQPPTTPTQVKATATAYNKVSLTWAASTDNAGVAGYTVFRDNVPVAELGKVTSYEDSSGLFADTSYSYRILATDVSGNDSPLSTAVTVRTPKIADTQAPTQPSGLSATAVNESQINLEWTASTDNVGVKAYDVYRGEGDNTPSKISSSTGTSFGDSGLKTSTEYSYYVVARDATGNLSEPSDTATAKTEAAPTDDGGGGSNPGDNGGGGSDNGGGNPTTPGGGGGQNDPQKKYGTLRGMVRNQRTKRPINGARVVLTVRQNKVIYSTGNRGRYVFRHLEQGRYNVSYRAKGYFSKSISVLLDSRNLERNVSLQRR